MRNILLVITLFQLANAYSDPGAPGKEPQQVSQQAIQSCLSYAAIMAAYPTVANYIKERCKNAEFVTKLNKMTVSGARSCIQNLRTTKSFYYAFIMDQCVYNEISVELSKKVGGCMENALPTFWGKYFTLEYEKLDRWSSKKTNFNYTNYPSQKQYFTNPYKDLIGNCLSDVKNGHSQEKIVGSGNKIIGEINIHSDQWVSLTDKNKIGGFSGAFYHRGTGSFFIATDDLGRYGGPRVFETKLKTNTNNTGLSLEIKKAWSVKENFPKDAEEKIDIEGLVHRHNGGFLFSIESGMTHLKSAIIGLDKNGRYIEIDTPDKYLRKSTPVKYIENRSPGYFSRQKTGGVQYAGLPTNRGVEGLTSTFNGKFLFAMAEGALLQDVKQDPNNKNNVRLIKYSRDTSGVFTVTKEFIYTIDEYKNNGVSEILALNKDQLLVLERSFVEGEGIRSILYLADIPTDSSIQHLTKNKVLDLKDMTPHFSPGARILENFEAMAIVPKSSKVLSPRLILFSDNNFKGEQFTKIVAIELHDQDVLEAIEKGRSEEKESPDQFAEIAKKTPLQVFKFDWSKQFSTIYPNGKTYEQCKNMILFHSGSAIPFKTIDEISTKVCRGSKSPELVYNCIQSTMRWTNGNSTKQELIWASKTCQNVNGQVVKDRRSCLESHYNYGMRLWSNNSYRARYYALAACREDLYEDLFNITSLLYVMDKKGDEVKLLGDDTRVRSGNFDIIEDFKNALWNSTPSMTAKRDIKPAYEKIENIYNNYEVTKPECFKSIWPLFKYQYSPYFTVQMTTNICKGVKDKKAISDLKTDYSTLFKKLELERNYPKWVIELVVGFSLYYPEYQSEVQTEAEHLLAKHVSENGIFFTNKEFYDKLVDLTKNEADFQKYPQEVLTEKKSYIQKATANWP